MISYNRDLLIEILIYHYRKDISSCGCGWSELGKSHSAHVVDVYEESIRAYEEVHGNQAEDQAEKS